MIIQSVAVVGGLGLVFGLGLAYAAKRFEVKKDEKVAKVRAVLPGVNCGACGQPGCDAFAEAVVAGKVPLDGCVPGQKKVADKIADILGGEKKDEKEKMVAQLHCAGDCEKAGSKFDYKGILTCNAANLVNNGPKQCVYGCMGLGDCVKVCPVDAICLNDKKLPVVDKEKCIGCGNCVKECPKKLYQLVPAKSKVHVLCKSQDPGKFVVKACKVGCIACKKCEGACKFDAIHVKDSLAQIDYSKCKVCGMCAKVCPRSIIIDERKAKNQEEQKKVNEEMKAAQENNNREATS